MMQFVGDVKCYHCGHVSGQIEGDRTDRLVLKRFKPEPSFKGALPKPGERIRCDRCGGPVFLEDLQQLMPTPDVIPLAKAKRKRASRSKAA